MERMSKLLSRRRRAGDRFRIAGAIRAPELPVPGFQAQPQWRAALTAAVRSALGVLGTLQVLMLISWVAAGTTGGPLDALAIGAYGWLLGHGVPLTVDLGPDGVGALSLHPLGLLLIVLVVLYRAGSRAARASWTRSLRDVAILVALTCVAYGLLVCGVAALTLGGPARPDLVVAAGAGLLVPAIGAGAGVVRVSGVAGELRARLPLDVRVALDAGLGAMLVLGAGGALVLTVSLLVHFPRVVGLTGVLEPDLTGWPLLLLLNLLLLPNAALYALAVATGPGFALGTGTSVSLAGTSVGAVPAVSLLGAVPDGVAAPPYAYAVLLVPLAAGVTAGFLSFARAPGRGAERAALRAGCAGLMAGVGTGAFAWLAGGALGVGRLTHVGPTAWLLGIVVAVEVGVMGAVTAWVACPRTVVAGGAVAQAAPAAPVLVASVPETPAVPTPALSTGSSGPKAAVLGEPARVVPTGDGPKRSAEIRIADSGIAGNEIAENDVAENAAEPGVERPRAVND